MGAEKRIRGAAEQVGQDSSGAPGFIRTSWMRCEEEFGLSSGRISKPEVLTDRELREISEPVEDLVIAANAELQNTFTHLKDHDYLVTLASNEGVTLKDFIPSSLEADARAFALYNGSMWGEAFQGTNGVGTAIQLGKAVSVVEDEHFSEMLTGLTCSAAPIFDAQRRLAAVLNVTTPRNTSHQEQAITLQVIKQAAKRIENLWFSRRYGAYSILQIANASSFSDLANSELIAIDDSGLLIASTLSNDSPLSPHKHSKAARNDYIGKVLGLSPEGLAEAIEQCKPLDLVKQGSEQYYIRSHNLKSLIPNKLGCRSGRKQARAHAGMPDLNEPTLSNLISANAKLQRFVNIAERAFEGGLSILLTGPTGTGKGAFAKALHNESSRSEQPFVPINCAAIPDELFESILFGYMPGAFTGAAKQGSQGSVLDANGGTLFLDEIGDMPLSSQVRLLRVLSEKEVTPLGSSVPIQVDINVVSATLHNLEDKINEGAFRSDLYYRIASVEIEIPALDEREDKFNIITELSDAVFKIHGKSGRVSTGAKRALESYSWKGNFRELISVLKYAAVLDTDDVIDLDDLPDKIARSK